jgi:hypothetical protein
MKRGQMAGVIVIFLVVAAIVALLFLSKKEGQEGKAIQMPETIVATPEPVEVVSKIIYQEHEPAQIRSEEPGPGDYCVGSQSARTCAAATSLARKQCPTGYECKTVSAGWSAEGCYVELHCSHAKPRSGIKTEMTGEFATMVGETCIASHSATTCHAARALAQKECPRGYHCKQTQLGLAPEGCFVELTCEKSLSGIKPREEYPLDTQPLPYAEGYYRPPPTPQ